VSKLTGFRKKLAADAVSRALSLRKKLGVSFEESVSPIDAAEQLSIDVRFVDLPSMEGIYIADNEPKIVLSSLRPSGRRSFTCAHELGHHMFGHGDRFDEVFTGRWTSRWKDPKEFVADCFGAYFLMPRTTIESGLHKRHLSYRSLTEFDIHKLACWLGVGYRTLITHFAYGLNAISPEKAERLYTFTPATIRAKILGRSVSTELYTVDEHWMGRPIDCEIGDIILLPRFTTTDGDQLVVQGNLADYVVAEAKAVGATQVSTRDSKMSLALRVTRRRYIGRSCYRFDEDIEEEDTEA